MTRNRIVIAIAAGLPALFGLAFLCGFAGS